jgi:hypothetical protein
LSLHPAMPMTTTTIARSAIAQQRRRPFAPSTTASSALTPGNSGHQMSAERKPRHAKRRRPLARSTMASNAIAQKRRRPLARLRGDNAVVMVNHFSNRNGSGTPAKDAHPLCPAKNPQIAEEKGELSQELKTLFLLKPHEGFRLPFLPPNRMVCGPCWFVGRSQPPSLDLTSNTRPRCMTRKTLLCSGQWLYPDEEISCTQ